MPCALHPARFCARPFPFIEPWALLCATVPLLMRDDKGLRGMGDRRQVGD
jgi:hypothetical protein